MLALRGGPFNQGANEMSNKSHQAAAQKSAAQAAEAKKPETTEVKEAKAATAAQAAEKKATSKKVKKHLLENTTERKMDINFVDDSGAVKTVSVPAARTEGNDKVNGWAVVDFSEIEAMKKNEVVAHYFDQGHLTDAGATDDDVELKTSEDDDKE